MGTPETPNIEALAALHEAAPKGPYIPDDVGYCYRYVNGETVTEIGYWIPEVEYLGDGSIHAMPQSAARFIAAAHAAFPWLLERARRADIYEAALREIVEYFNEGGYDNEVFVGIANRALEETTDA